MHSADDWRSVLVPVIARYRGRSFALYFRGDAAFAKPELYELLEAESIGYVIRLPANAVLQERIGHLLIRPVGRTRAAARAAPARRRSARSSRNGTYQEQRAYGERTAGRCRPACRARRAAHR